MLGTVMRAGAVLDLFTEHEPEWGATATAAQLGIAKSLAHEELSSLAAIGLLRRVDNGRYRIGWRALSLATELLRSSDLNATVTPLARELARACNVAVAVMAWERGRAVCINSQRHTQMPPLAAPQVGRSRFAGDGAADRVLLAGRPTDELKTLWETGILHTRERDFERLVDELAEVRRQGWAADDDRTAEHSGARWVAAPVHDMRGNVAAAISLSHPAQQPQHPVAADARLACAAASRITRALRDRDQPHRATVAASGDNPSAHAGASHKLRWSDSSASKLSADVALREVPDQGSSANDPHQAGRIK